MIRTLVSFDHKTLIVIADCERILMKYFKSIESYADMLLLAVSWNSNKSAWKIRS